MDVIIIATKGCSHCQNFSKELDEIGIEHQVKFAEDEPNLCESLAIRHSPNLLVDGEVIFRGQVDEVELRNYFNNLSQ